MSLLIFSFCFISLNISSFFKKKFCLPFYLLILLTFLPTFFNILFLLCLLTFCLFFSNLASLRSPAYLFSALYPLISLIFWKKVLLTFFLPICLPFLKIYFYPAYLPFAFFCNLASLACLPFFLLHIP